MAPRRSALIIYNSHKKIKFRESSAPPKKIDENCTIWKCRTACARKEKEKLKLKNGSDFQFRSERHSTNTAMYTRSQALKLPNTKTEPKDGMYSTDL